ncbi:MAG: hypothetical protein NTW37_04510 [Proteobacteria bacterium]|nr:hypothetical protein [Pseudomonadota bacterium]
MVPPTTPPAPPGGTTPRPGSALLAEGTVLRRKVAAPPAVGILTPALLKVYGLVGEQITAVGLRKSAGMEDTALIAAVAELIERGLITADPVKAEDPLDLDFTSAEALEKLRALAAQVKQAEEDARLRVDAERKAKLQAEARVRDETEAKARADADAKVNAAALARLKAEKIARSESDSEINTRQAALDRAEAEARERADALARAEAEAKARAESVRKAEANAAARLSAVRRMEGELKGRMAAMARVDAARQRKSEAEAQARGAEAEGARQAALANAEAERRAREAAEQRAEAERALREQAEANAALQAEAERRAREQTQALIEAERVLREEAEARVRVLSSTEREDREKTEAERESQPLAGLKPTARPAPMSTPAAASAAPPEAAQSPVPDADALARAQQERFSRELEAQMARITAEQAAPSASAGAVPGKPGSSDEATRAADARERAEEFARQQMIDIMKLEEKRAKEEEQRRLLAEEESRRRAREAVEIASRARAEREKFERDRERKRKLAEAEAQALARVVARAERQPTSRWKLVLGGLVLFAATVIGLFEVFPFNAYVGRVEALMSTALGERVVIKSMHASLIPRPNIRLTDVTVGSGTGGATIASVRAVPAVSSLFRGPLTFESVQFDSVTVAQEFIPKLPDVVGMGGGHAPGLERILIRNLRLTVPDIELPPAEVEIVWDASGRFRSANIRTFSGRVSIDLTRAAEDIAFRMSATEWQPLRGNPATLGQLKMNGTLTRNGLAASEVVAELYGGEAKGSFRVDWGAAAQAATASGEFLLRRLDVEKFLPAMTVNATATGLMDGTMKFSLQAPLLRRLFESPQVTTAFTIRRGWVGGVDLARLLRDSTNRGGRTVFEEWTGVYAMSGGNHSLRQMRLTSGPMSASGAAEISAQGMLTGRISAQLSTANDTAVRANFSLGGSIQKIEVGN